MQSQLRVMQLRAVRPAQRRAMATIPPTPPPSGAAPVRPVVVTVKTVPVPGSSSLPPPPPPPVGGALPPPPPPPPRRGFFRRFLLYTTLGALVFYPTSGLIGSKSETYREFFTENFPGGEFVADQVESLLQGQPTVITPGASTSSRVDQAVKDARAEAEAKARAGKATLEQKGAEAKGAMQSAAQQAQKKAEEAKAAASQKAEEVKSAAAKRAEELKAATAKKTADAKSAASDAAAKAEHEAATLKDRVVKAATDAKDKVAETAKAVPFNAGDGLEALVRKAEGAVEKGEKKLASAVETVKEKADPNAPRILPDTQRPRELRPETVTPAKPSFEGKEKYTGELPLGFEPPPGYYVPPPPKVEGAKVADKTLDAKPVLPLLAPKVKDFGTDEPIISQLASTIDSLASSLSSPGGAAAAGATGVLSKAQADLSALSSRLSEVKKAEKAKLEKALADKTKEFEATLKSAESSRAQNEQGLQDKWLKEREGMVADWKKKMETELEGQREGIEKRLREEVVSQGIELQRRWLRSIKAQVEEERGGRLAKLDHLSTSLKQLERITLDNSATLDDNVRVHKVWSALRAVQSKAEQGDVSFNEELRVLKALASTGDNNTTGAAAVAQLEQSGVALTGVKSLSALSSWFTTSVSPRVHSASLVPAPEKAGVVSHLASWSLSSILFKPRAGPVEGTDVSAVLARAEWCLAEKDLDGAAREVNRLQGWPAKLAGDWLREARRALEVRQALDVVATEATLGSLLLV